MSMHRIKNGWFTESCQLWPGGTFSLEVKQVLYSGRSSFQSILVLNTVSYGRVLVLNDVIKCTEKDEFAYQEMMSFLPLCSHANPEKVLIIGGGDGGIAREVAKHPKVKKIVQVEIDEEVMNVSKKYLPHMAVGYHSRKLEIRFGNGAEYLMSHKKEFDVIITDTNDPIGPAISLFDDNYFAMAKKSLKPNGILCSQGGYVWNNMRSVVNTLKSCKQSFPVTSFAYSCVPTYPSGQIGFALGSLDPTMKFNKPKYIFSVEEQRNFKLKYYNEQMHLAAFILPTFVENKLMHL